MKCPICGKTPMMEIPLSWIQGHYHPKNDRKLVKVQDYLYQYSYKDEEEYISPRCSKCFDKRRSF